jgi:hypothetical protein
MQHFPKVGKIAHFQLTSPLPLLLFQDLSLPKITSQISPLLSESICSP